MAASQIDGLKKVASQLESLYMSKLVDVAATDLTHTENMIMCAAHTAMNELTRTHCHRKGHTIERISILRPK